MISKQGWFSGYNRMCGLHKIEVVSKIDDGRSMIVLVLYSQYKQSGSGNVAMSPAIAIKLIEDLVVWSN